jgi:DNA-binding transcriptional regulator YhcF (GntR family)
MIGWVKYNRMLLDSDTFQRGNSYITLFTYILLNVQYKNSYRSTVKQGQMKTDYKSLAENVGIAPHTVRRMLINIQKDGLITVENKQNRYTLITVNDWQLYQDAISGWVQLDRNIEWIQNAEIMGEKLYALLSQNQCNASVTPQQDECKTAVTPYNRNIKNKEQKKEEVRMQPLAEKLAEVFVRRNFSQRDSVHTLSKQIGELLNSGITAKQVEEAIGYFANNRFEQVYNGYTFKIYFPALYEAVERSKVAIERTRQLEEEARLKEIKYEQGVKELKLAVELDKFHIVRRVAHVPKFALQNLRGMVARGDATAEEAEKLLEELHLYPLNSEKTA